MKSIRLKYHVSLPAAAVRHPPTGPRIMKSSCLRQAEEGGMKFHASSENELFTNISPL